MIKISNFCFMVLSIQEVVASLLLPLADKWFQISTDSWAEMTGSSVVAVKSLLKPTLFSNKRLYMQGTIEIEFTTAMV